MAKCKKPARLAGRCLAAQLVVLCLAIWPGLPAWGWGKQGHQEINRVAAGKMPREMPGFFRSRAAKNRIEFLAPEPDRWRDRRDAALLAAQAPDHFIDLERIEWMQSLPTDRYQYYRALYQKRSGTKQGGDQYLPERVGLQPYATIEVYERLREAFREYRMRKAASKPTKQVEQNILFYAGWLGHYAADGSQPLHTTVSYDGWVGPNPKGYETGRGLHAKFESTFVEKNVRAADFAPLLRGPVELKHPFDDYVNYLELTHAQVEEVYALEKAGGFDGMGTAESRAFTEKRLAAGAQMLADLWFTAWKESAP